MDPLLLVGIVVLVAAIGLVWWMGKKKKGQQGPPQSPQAPQPPQNPPMQ